MRRLSDDDGAIAVVVALLAVVLFGFGALVIDVGALYSERRQLQVGADAAALAIAQACAGGDCGSYNSDAEAFAGWNALDGEARVTTKAGETGGPRVCGTTSAGLPECVDPPADIVGSGYVRVTTSTEESDGGLLVPPFLARILVPDYDGTEVHAESVVAWGSAGVGDADLAITFSQCEYNELTGAPDNTVYATKPYDPALEKTIYFHGDPEAGTCPAGPSGADLPGGFGWLADPTSTCTVDILDSGWYDVSTGASASQACKAALDDLVTAGEPIAIPVFDAKDGTGAGGSYELWNSVGFVLTGYRFPGINHDPPCSAPLTCISGYFVELVSSGGPISDSADQGVRVVQLIS